MSEFLDMNGKIEVEINPAAASLRLVMLMTHYRSPLNYTDKKIKEATKILKRWSAVAEPCDDLPPTEVIEALCDDLNTPKAIAAMHRYRNKREGRKLYASMRFLGFMDVACVPSETKVVPG